MAPALIVIGLGLVMIGTEWIFPGRSWPAIRGWFPRALAFNAVQLGVVWLAGVAWDPWLSTHRPWSAEPLGLAGGSIVGYLVVTFIYYWWHRWRHESDFLWRWFHQVHHSPRRIEIITSFYKHPVEIVVNGILSSAILYALVGLTPSQATIAVTLTGIAELFYHWNVRTPYLLGFLIQRPESHCIHHEEGLHSFNFADLPLWDWMFGTLRNPRQWDARCGFGDRELRIAEMLVGKDVNRE